MRGLALAAFLALAALPAPAQDGAPQPADAAKLKELYDQAFEHYKSGRFSPALHVYNDILKADPEQKTARQMVLDVRTEINRRNQKRLKALYAHVGAGLYPKALVELQSLIEEDESHPRFKALQESLQEVAAIAPTAPPRTKPWKIARQGLWGVLGPGRDPRLAHNGLRYAAELDPREERFRRLLDWLLSRYPELSGTDAVTPGMSLIRYKHVIALNQIYDGKYHLAVDTLNEILTLEPDDVLALKRLGTSYYSLRQWQEAREAWLRAQRLSPKDPQLAKFLRKLDSRRAR